MRPLDPDLAGSPDRLRWNARYGERGSAPFTPHPLAVRALALAPPDGPVLDLASGPSGAALLAAGTGRRVIAVDVSEVALGLLGEEAARRGLAGLITLVHADLTVWQPPARACALVLCTGYWEPGAFARATGAVAGGGVIAWEAFTAQARARRPGLDPAWCLGPGEPASLLPAPFTVLGGSGPQVPGKRRLLARRRE